MVSKIFGSKKQFKRELAELSAYIKAAPLIIALAIPTIIVVGIGMNFLNDIGERLTIEEPTRPASIIEQENSKKNYIEQSTTSLFSEAEKNSIRFDNNWRGKTFTIQGVIKQFSWIYEDDVVIECNGLHYFHCRLKDKSRIMNYNVGSMVQLSGIVDSVQIRRNSFFGFSYVDRIELIDCY